MARRENEFFGRNISRGDERMGALLKTAFRKGCRFDGWSEILRFDLWQEAIAETGINPEDFTRERDISETLPWDNIDCGVSREFLLRENKDQQTKRQQRIAGSLIVKTAEYVISLQQKTLLPHQRKTKQLYHRSQSLIPPPDQKKKYR